MSRYGSAEVDSTYPRAHAICDRCGKRTNHYKLSWQFDWRGPRMQNLRVLVCDSCYDRPQQNGQRTIILPPDPLPVMNARPEQYVPANNPLSGIGMNPNLFTQTGGAFIGTMFEGGGLNAAFDGNSNKPSNQSATITTPRSSFDNYIGVNWSEAPATLTPSSLNSPVRAHSLSSWSFTIPNDRDYGNVDYVVQGSNVAGAWGTWTTISSGNLIDASAGDLISGPGSGGPFQFHRVAFAAVGGFSGTITISQVSFSVNETSSNSGGL